MKQNRSRERIALASDLAQVFGTPVSILLSLGSFVVAIWSSIMPSFAKGIHWSPRVWMLLSGLFLTIFIGLLFRRRFRVRQRRRRHSLAQRAATGYMRVGALSEARKLDLGKVFVPPRLRMIDASTLRQFDGREYSPKRVLRHATSERQDGVVFTGVAGSGKSVLAQWLVYSLAVLEAPGEWEFLMRSLPEKERTGRIAELRERWKRFLERLQLRPEAWELRYPYPFFVDLWEGAILSGEPSAELVLDLLSQGDDRPQLIQLAQNGLILPVFDGLDQLSEESQHRFWESLRAFMRKYHRNGPFVLTMRDYGAVNVDPSMAALSYSLWHIQAFNERQVRRYVQRYFSARDSKEADTSERLWKAIETTAETAPQIWQWLTEPLLMALITSAFDLDSPTPLPRDRINLFEAYLRDMRARQRLSPAIGGSNSQQRNVPFSIILDKTAFRAMEYCQTELVDAKRQLGQYAGVLTRPSESRPEFYRFTHLSIQTYFAARYLSDQLQRNSLDLAHEWWEKSVLRALPSGRNGSTPDVEENDNWQSNWRELLTFTTGMLTPSLSSPAASGSIVWQETPIYQRAAWIGGSFPAPLSTILSLRLMHAMQERGAVIDALIDQEQIIEALLDVLPTLRPSWSRDVWELSFLLDDVGWERLRQLAFAPDTNRQMVRLLGALRHRRAAEILLDLVCEQHRLSPEIARAIEGTGMAAVRPIVAAFRRVKDRNPQDLELQAILIELMGYSGSAREFGAILSGSRHSEGIVFGRDVPDELVQVSYEALARWGSDGSQTLLTCLRRAHKLSTRLKDSLVEALSQADLDDEIDALMVYLHKDSVQKQMVVRVIANKLDNAPNSADVFVQFMNQERTRFNRVSHSLWRDILKALEKRRLMHSRSSWQHKGYTTLYEWLRSLNLPSANYLRALLEICGCTDAELAGRWIEDALQDTLFEVREEALNAFVQRSRRSANHCSWLHQSRHELPSYVVQELEYRLGKSQLLRDQATASVSASSVVVTQ